MFDRDELLARVELTALADDLLGPHTGTARAPRWPCPSPTHAQTGATPPLSVFRARSGDQRWHCFGCGTGGTAVDLVMVARGIDVRAALEQLAVRARLSPTAGGPPPPPRRRSVPPPPAPTRSGAAVAAYVQRCQRLLWTATGAPVRRYLCQRRGLPADVLRTNGVGADPGPAVLPRPAGLPRWGPAAVFPIAASPAGPVGFVTVRLLHPRRCGPKYLNPTADVATNPRVGLFHPARAPAIAGWVITEGPLDALSAAAAGYPAAAVLGAGAGDERAADRLAALPGPLVVAWDADPAGRAGADRLQRLLADRGRPSVSVVPPAAVGDLNGWLTALGDGFGSAFRLALHLAHAAAPAPAPTRSPAAGLGR